MDARMEETEEDQSATTLELFFDLVFVFAVTQVTAFMAHDLDGWRIVQGLAVLALFWWGWVGYAWLCNLVRADEGPVRLILLLAMAVMFLVALAIPEAFHDLPGGLDGPYVIAGCYFAFRLTHLALFWVYAEGDAALRRQLLRFCPTIILSTAFLVLAAHTDSPYTATYFWLAALASDYGGTVLGGASGWRLRSAGHFAERHGLMVIIGLGESIVAIGAGTNDQPISWPVIAAAAAGVALAAAMWWIYFDISALKGEEALDEVVRGGGNVSMARDAYSILHLPLMAGIVLMALGLKKAMQYVGNPHEHQLTDPLGALPAAALFGGVLLYLLGHIGFKLRTLHRFSTPRAGLAVVVAVAWLVSGGLPALGQIVLLAALVWALAAYETVHYAEERARTRHAGHTHA
ncbi:low temperature requirement protein A [Nocardioides phosphati]|uniref:Low temperature requirement protein A n=1 Tax=Nocardioides phosphati TaxID=1867775 RepID=A0ABQ2NE34_9ACTN|nr:low temperature requirement protein A [Nocardioides phosphati]GGO91983.1 low temperature requirement protein A [Nocardioides phosphati]